jgi:NADPH:quinone reductase-like Zn-dependent oxidoreductase
MSSNRMRALVYRRYGGPEVLEPTDTETPVAGDGQILVRVKAVGLNPYDLHFLHGDPYIARPQMGTGLRKPRRPMILGSDVAGVVEAIGPNATGFCVGDEVFGTVWLGGLADLVAVSAGAVAPKPEGLSFEQAAALPMAALTALQGLRDVGGLRSGQRVIVNGAAGGVGSFAVQLAKALGASAVTGVCSAASSELVRSLGADEVIDYGREDFTRLGRRYDLLFETVGNRSLRSFCRALEPSGTLVLVGAGGGRVLGPMAQILGAKLQSRFLSPRILTMFVQPKAEDLLFIKHLVEEGKLRPAMDRSYPLAQAADALRHLETRHAHGKVVVAMTGAGVTA